MSFSKTITHDSKAVPGARFTIHRMGFGRRVDLDMKTLALRQRLRELEVESPPPSDLEAELHRQIAVARKKAAAVPEDEVDAVIERDLFPLLDELRKAQEAAGIDVKKKRLVSQEEYSQVETQIRVAWIRDGLISIEHEAGDGESCAGMTADELLQYGPPGLALEIYDALAADGKLAGPDAKNSHSPIIFGAPVGGETTASTAPNAGSPPSATT